MIVHREQLRLADRINMVGTTAARPAACESNAGCLYLATDDDGGTLFRSNGSSWVQVAKGVSESGGGGGNALLDGSVHTDTVAQAVSRGSLVYGNSTPAWDELTIGADAKVLTSDGTDPAWRYVAPMAVWETGISSGVTVSSLTTSWATLPTFRLNLGGLGTYDVNLGNSVVIPGGWLDGFSSLAHRFTAEAYRSSGTGTIELRLYDVTNSNAIATITGINAASRTFYSTTSFSNVPSGDAIVELQGRYQTSSSNLTFYGLAWHAKPDTSV